VVNPFRILGLGDSIIWGQGLLPEEKFTTLVQQALLPAHPEGVTLESLAHSGAVIGANGATGTPQVEEVPASRLSIIEQCDGFASSPDNVDLVIMNGGINDVGVATILNPLALIPSLDAKLVHACHDGMLVLLKKVSAKFSKSTCRILVAGYYPILSAMSDPVGVSKLLSLFGVAVPDFLEKDFDFINPVFNRCEAFFKDSTTQLMKAIADAGDPRITFVPSGFTDANSAFVPNTSLLWSLTLTDDLAPQDPVAPSRHPLCEAAYPNPVQVLDREICYRASAGHPNVQGAVQFSKQIMGALRGIPASA
jgi:lysophospholipase L1-like esterase